jgi:hypothetical protein
MIVRASLVGVPYDASSATGRSRWGDHSITDPIIRAVAAARIFSRRSTPESRDERRSDG